MNEKHYLTQEQYTEFKEKLERLINVELPQNAENIATAVAQGDLSENAEYEIAKDEQFRLNKEVARIKGILANAVIIKQNASNDFVEIGHKVTIQSLDTDSVETITLMGYGNGIDTISIDSPLGQALLHKSKGDITIVDAPIGELNYKILSIE